MPVIEEIKKRLSIIEKLEIPPKAELDIKKYLGDIENALDQIHETYMQVHDRIGRGQMDWPDKWTVIGEINETR